MSINKKVIITVAIGLALGAASCRKFLNVNQNPNVSSTATVQTLLPAAQLYVASTVGVDLQINGSFWAQYWTQDPGASQYRTLDQYAPNPDYFSTPWTNLYAAAENFKQLYALADTLHKKQYMAIALVMKAYTFQLITDAWGDAPYSQALNGQFVDSNITSPKYDAQKAIYSGIIVNIDSALSLMNTSDAAAPGPDDLVYGGNMAKWEKFAYTLKLRIYMRMSQVDPVDAQAGITKLYNTPGVAFIGSSAGDDASIAFGFSSTNKSPLYAEESSTTTAGEQNFVGSSTCIDSMNSNGDPRAYIFYEATSSSSGSAVSGLAQGDYGSTTPSTAYSLPSTYVAGDANNTASTNAPVNLLTSWESLFLQAEVVAKGWEGTSSGKTDDSLFYYGIQASFNYYSKQLVVSYDTALQDVFGVAFPIAGISPYNDYITGQFNGVPGYWTVYPTTGTFAQKQRFIITQKWFAMCGNQGFEAWSELRRTGYPDFLVVSKHGTSGTIPKRFLYPTSESTRNANFPGEVVLNVKTWWDLF